MTLADWCRMCGHARDRHADRCTGLTRVGPGGEYDGGDFAPCRCAGFAPLEAQT